PYLTWQNWSPSVIRRIFLSNRDTGNRKEALDVRSHKLAGLAVFGVCLFSATATTTRADNFVLTGGRAATGETTLNLFLSGPNFQLDVAAAFARTLSPLVQGCTGSSSNPCTSGATFNLDFSVDAGEFTYGRA